MNRKKYLLIAAIVVVVALSILLYTVLANQRLVITSLKTEPEVVPPWESCQIVCNATAPQGDVLSYNWSADGGQITGAGAIVTWTAPNSAGSYNVTVTVSNGHGAEARKRITIKVRANNPPTINSLVASANWTTPSSSLQVTCNATDPDSDVLTYEWTIDGGKISGAGAAVHWTAPQKVGAYNITVVVNDGYGGEDMRRITLSVALGTPPTIEKLVVTPNGNTFLRKGTPAGCDFDVWVNEEYDIKCLASNTSDELSYEWACAAGNISGEGSMITWKAPSEKSVTVTVTVIVSDAEGNSIGKNIVFHVASCICGSWGLKSGEIAF